MTQIGEATGESPRS